MSGSQIRANLSKIIDSLIEDAYPMTLDDDMPDLLDDTDKREEAIDKLIKMIEFYREDL